MSTRTKALLLLTVSQLLGASSAGAHDLRVAHLTVTAAHNGTGGGWNWNLQQPTGSARFLEVVPPTGCVAQGSGRWLCDSGGPRGALRVLGAAEAAVDVVVLWRGLGDRNTWTAVIRGSAHERSIQIDGKGGGPRPGALLALVARGLRHALFGWDHVLFIVGLVFLLGQGLPGRRSAPASLAVTLTGFTVGHGVGMTLAILVGAGIPTAAVEILIALSVLLLWLDVAKGRTEHWLGREGWVMVAVFGVVHGAGLASVVLRLPEGGHGQALKSIAVFGLGVELSHILVAVVAWALAPGLARTPRLQWCCQRLAGGFSCTWLVLRLGGIA